MENREATSAQVREKMEMTEAMTREQENATDPKESEHKMFEQVQETKEKEQGGGVKCIKEDKEQLLPDQKADSCSPSRPSDEGCSDTPKTSDEYELLVAELKEELKRVRADADLEVSALEALIFHIFCSH